MLSPTMTAILTWAGIGLCISQAGILSGLNLAVFGPSRLRLHVEAATGNRDAAVLLSLRQHSNHMLATILWANVAVNVLLTLLSESVLAGVAAFLFATFVITILGEIVPQAYFTRRAIRMAALFAPLLRAYSVVLFPIALPSATLLDWWLGREGMSLFREREMRELIRAHIESDEAEVARLEGLGAMNFLEIDDLTVLQEGQLADPASVVSLPFAGFVPVFPDISRTPDDPFLLRIHRSGRKWIIIAGLDGNPVYVLNSDEFLRGALFGAGRFNPLDYCHRPIIVRNPHERLGNVISRLRPSRHRPSVNVIEFDVILIWTHEKRVITGADILGRLLSGVTDDGARPTTMADGGT